MHKATSMIALALIAMAAIAVAGSISAVEAAHDEGNQKSQDQNRLKVCESLTEEQIANEEPKKCFTEE